MDVSRSKQVHIVLVSAICCCAAISVYTFVRSVTKKRTLQNVPIIESNSVFGFTGLLSGLKCHEVYLSVAEEKGPIVQYNLFGVHRVVISDMKLAKQILKELVRKIPCVEGTPPQLKPQHQSFH